MRSMKRSSRARPNSDAVEETASTRRVCFGTKGPSRHHGLTHPDVAVSSKRPATMRGSFGPMEMGLKDSVVIVTGASAGIGRAIAVAFAREGARVAITYHTDPAGAERTAEMVRGAGGEPMVARFALEEIASAVALVDAVYD